VEAIEADVPVVMLRHEPLPDSAGPGRHRGGAAMVRDTLWTAPAEHHLMSLRAKRAAGFGVQGGGEGRPGGVWVFDPGDGSAPGTGPEAYRAATPLAGVVDPETNVLDPGGTYVYPFPPAGHATAPGAILRYVNTGGGGWGDPLAREPEAVKRDVRDGYVSIEGAARDYGVVITGDPEEDPEGLTLDLAATERLRADQTK
jgi:N-methylhydantoinase B